MVEIDLRGLACPMPVVKTKKAIEENPGIPLTVFVDNAIARENVSRLAKSKGYSVQAEETPNGFRLALTPPGK